MNNQEFYKLQKDIQAALDSVKKLRDVYRAETGFYFCDGQKIKPPKLCDTCRFLREDGKGWFCNYEVSEFYEDRDPVDGCAEWDDE